MLEKNMLVPLFKTRFAEKAEVLLRFWWSIFVFTTIYFFSSDVYAATTLGQIICTANTTGNGYAHVLNAGSYVVGAFLIVRGVLLSKKHAENPNDSQVTKSVAHLFGGGVLMALPSFVGIIQRSIFGVGSGAGAGNCAPGGVANSAASLDVMMQNFVKDMYNPMFSLLSMLSIIIGLTFIARALLRGAKTGSNPQASDPKSIITHLVIGAVLVSMGQMLPSTLQSLFGSGAISSMTSYQGMNWSKLVGTGVDVSAMETTTRAVLAFVQIIGGIAFLRGWLVLKTAIEGGGQATVPQAVTFIVGGAMAINIDVMIAAIDRTFGTGIISS